MAASRRQGQLLVGSAHIPWQQLVIGVVAVMVLLPLDSLCEGTGSTSMQPVNSDSASTTVANPESVTTPDSSNIARSSPSAQQSPSAEVSDTPESDTTSKEKPAMSAEATMAPPTTTGTDSKVTKAAEDSSEVPTAAADSSGVTTAAADNSKVTTVAADEAKVTTVAADNSKVTTTAADDSEVKATTDDTEKKTTASSEGTNGMTSAPAGVSPSSGIPQEVTTQQSPASMPVDSKSTMEGSMTTAVPEKDGTTVSMDEDATSDVSDKMTTATRTEVAEKPTTAAVDSASVSPSSTGDTTMPGKQSSAEENETTLGVTKATGQVATTEQPSDMVTNASASIEVKVSGEMSPSTEQPAGAGTGATVPPAEGTTSGTEVRDGKLNVTDVATERPTEMVTPSTEGKSDMVANVTEMQGEGMTNVTKGLTGVVTGATEVPSVMVTNASEKQPEMVTSEASVTEMQVDGVTNDTKGLIGAVTTVTEGPGVMVTNASESHGEMVTMVTNVTEMQVGVTNDTKGLVDVTTATEGPSVMVTNASEGIAEIANTTAKETMGIMSTAVPKSNTTASVDMSTDVPAVDKNLTTSEQMLVSTSKSQEDLNATEVVMTTTMKYDSTETDEQLMSTAPSVTTGKDSVVKNSTFVITFEGDCAVLLEEEELRAKFEEKLISSLENKLDIGPHNEVKIQDMACGSVVVTVLITNVTAIEDYDSKLEGLVKNGDLNITLDNKNNVTMVYSATKLNVHAPSALTPSTTPATTQKMRPVKDDNKLSNAEKIVIIVCCVIGGSMIMFAIIACCIACRQKRFSKTFDLGITPKSEGHGEDFTLTKMDRPKPVYQEPRAAHDTRIKVLPSPKAGGTPYTYSNGQKDMQTFQNSPLLTDEEKGQNPHESDTLPLPSRLSPGEPADQQALITMKDESPQATPLAGYENPSFSSDDLLDSGPDSGAEELPHDTNTLNNQQPSPTPSPRPSPTLESVPLQESPRTSDHQQGESSQKERPEGATAF